MSSNRTTKQITETVVYTAGFDLDDARRNRDNSERDNPQDAYDAFQYSYAYEGQSYEVFEFHSVETVQQVIPPYSKEA